MDEETKTYPVLSNIRMDGTLYAPDTEYDKIDLTKEQHTSLKAVGCVGDALDDGEEDALPALTDEERFEKIKEAIGGLDAEKDFKQDGAPKAKPVNTLLDFDVSAEEINAVWEKIKSAGNE